MIIVYTGDGKGKTSAAIGLVYRAYVYGKKIGYIQFMKSVGNAASQLPKFFKGLLFYSYGTNAFVDPKNPSKEAKEEAKKALSKAKELIEKVDLLILDELNVALGFGLLSTKEIVEWLQNYRLDKSKKHYNWPIIVATGRYAPKELINIADLVTEMKEIKHPFKQGFLATKGIDF